MQEVELAIAEMTLLFIIGYGNRLNVSVLSACYFLLPVATSDYVIIARYLLQSTLMERSTELWLDA